MSLMWQERKTFYLVLIAMFVLHCSVMVMQIRDHLAQKTWTPPEVIKVKLIQEALTNASSKHKKQIVQSEDTAANEKPKEAAFLSDKDRTFDRQTVARNIESFK